MKVVEQFKRRILDLAIRGKLVPQDPNDEPASELLARIKAEKEKLIKAGKIKKGKSSAVGSDGAAYEKLSRDVAFDLPQGWVWMRLGDLCTISTGKRDANYGETNGRYYFFTCATLPIRCNGYSFEGESILLAGNGDIGNISYFDGKFEAYQRTYVLQALVPSCLILRYLYWHLKANWVTYNNDITYGSAIPYIRLGNLMNYFVALPPLTEQRRIVARVEELLNMVDSLGAAAGGLETAAKRLDKKILDLAIRGKLVPQDPSDEPASELLKRIAITSHRSPCKNHETPIEPPFAIPESWEWVRLGNVSDIIRGTGIKRSETSESGVQCVRYGEIYTDYGYSFSCSVSHVPLAVAEKCHEATFGDVLCTLTGENEVEIAKATAYLGKDRLVIGGDLAKITNHPYDPMLLVYFLFSPFMISQKAAVCTGGMIVHMGKSALSNLLIPLPPLAEQKRIVAKIEELRKVTQMFTM